jgi:small subunit ribosomal protein S21
MSEAGRSFCTLFPATHYSYIRASTCVPEGPRRRAEVPCLPVSSRVLIGRDCTYRHGFVLWVRSASADGPSGLAVGPINRLIEKELHVQVFVRDNNVDQALKALKKKMQREGIFREMKLRGHYEKPSERRAREKAEAIRRARKLARKKLQREGLLPMKPRVVPGTVGRGGPARGRRF